MSSDRLVDHPEAMVVMLAKLTARAGGHLVIEGHEEPTGPYNLLHRFTATGVELRLVPYGISGVSVHPQEGTA